MDTADNGRSKCAVDRTVFCDPRLTVKSGGGDFNAPMAFAGAVIAGVASMQMAFVNDV